MTIKGVTEKEQQILDSIFSKFSDKYEFYFYGSRVKGNYRFLSDLDVLVKGGITLDDLDTLRTLCDNSNLPYVVNFADFDNIDKKFYELIKDSLVKWG